MFIDNLKTHTSMAHDSKVSGDILGITTSSMKVKNNFLFIAEKGVSNDGHKYIPQAIENGASALLVENLDAVPNNYQGYVFTTPNTRAIAPHLAALFYHNPSEKLFCIGVTGTNGKTSLTVLLEHFFNAANRPTGVIGTINHHLGEKVWATNHTTPNPIDLQERLADFVTGEAQTLAIEVTSHAIDQKRIEGIEFDVGVFTNLTHDHLDYHPTMEHYFNTKQLLFTDILERSKKNSVYSVVNLDDPWGAKIVSTSRAKVWTYGTSRCDFSFKLRQMDFTGTEFRLLSPEGEFTVKSPLIGVHNIYNVLAAIAAAFAGGLSIKFCVDQLPSFQGIPGRLQSVPNHRDISVLIDYAHTPDALENVLRSLNKVRTDHSRTGKIICLFGCGGERDKSKRPIMAGIAENLSDLVIVTSDNPRTEEPLQIINDICQGFKNAPTQKVIVEPDRSKAIAVAVSSAKPKDVILIAGKGHEDYQIIGKERYYFSDFEMARKLLV